MINRADRVGIFGTPEGIARWPHWLVLLLLLAPMALAYASALSNGFVYDDHFEIAHNPRIRSLQDLTTYFVRPVKQGSITEQTSQYHYRPLLWLSFLVDYKLWGLRPFGYHLTSVLLHLINAGLLYLLLFRLFQTRSLAFASSLLWGLHPVHTDAVTWISGRPFTLSCSFALFALLLFHTSQEQQGRRKGAAAAGSAACVGLALLSYEAAISLPAIALLLDWAKARREGRTWRPSLAHLLLWGVLAAYILLRFTIVPVGKSVSTWAGITDQLGTRLLRTPGLILVYLKLLALPLRLSPDHSPEIPRPTAVWEATVWVPIILLVALVGLAWRMRQRSWVPLVGLVWFGLALAPVANLLPIYKLIAERFLYLPSVGISLAAVAGCKVALDRSLQQYPGYPWRRAVTVILALFIAGYGLRVSLRNRDWRDDVTLFLAAVEASPQSPQSYANLGRAYLMNSQYQPAEQAYRQAIALKPDFAHAFFGLGLAYQGQGQPGQAIAALQRAVELNPRYAGFHVGLGTAYLRAGSPDSAIAELHAALALNPASAEAHYILGLTYQRAGKSDLAQAAFEKARSIDPMIGAGR